MAVRRLFYDGRPGFSLVLDDEADESRTAIHDSSSNRASDSEGNGHRAESVTISTRVTCTSSPQRTQKFIGIVAFGVATQSYLLA